MNLAARNVLKPILALYWDLMIQCIFYYKHLCYYYHYRLWIQTLYLVVETRY